MQFTCHEKLAEILFENFKAVARKFRASSTYLIVHALVHYYGKETTNLPQLLATEYIDRRYKPCTCICTQHVTVAIVFTDIKKLFE